MFVVHGDAEVIPAFSAELEGMGFTTYAPLYTAVYDLLENREVEHGYQPEKKHYTPAARVSELYGKLLAAGEALMALIKRSKGMANKDTAAFTSQIYNLIERWK